MMADQNEKQHSAVHIDTRLDAYLDGELGPAVRIALEAHLDGCQRCEALLAQRRSLSLLLQEAPPAAGLKHEELFLAEVKRGVRAERSGLQMYNALRLAWQFAPLGLLLAWIFLQSVSILSGVLAFIPGAERFVNAGIFTGFTVTGFMESGLAALGLDWLGLTSFYNPLVWNGITNLVLLAGIGLLYLGWLASWWARSQGKKQFQQVKEIAR